MSGKNKKKGGLISTDYTVAKNRRASFDYHLEDKFDAGIVLTGTEVKSLRHGQASITEAYINEQDGEIWIHNMNIPEYQQASAALQHQPQRTRKLLLKKREIDKLAGTVKKGGYTIVPVALYFDKKGLVKITIALGKGKKLHDKREDKKTKDWNRDKQRIMSERG